MTEITLNFARLITAMCKHAEPTDDEWQEIADEMYMSSSTINALIDEAQELVAEAETPEEF
tara:strand:- start:29 stop:211 length:183 start_codon:yes stop_codon:yes gene_type:complete